MAVSLGSLRLWRVQNSMPWPAPRRDRHGLCLQPNQRRIRCGNFFIDPVIPLAGLAIPLFSGYFQKTVDRSRIAPVKSHSLLVHHAAAGRFKSSSIFRVRLSLELSERKAFTSSGEGSVPVKSCSVAGGTPHRHRFRRSDKLDQFTAVIKRSIGLGYWETSSGGRLSVNGRNTGIAAMPLSYRATTWVSPLPTD